MKVHVDARDGVPGSAYCPIAHAIEVALHGGSLKDVVVGDITTCITFEGRYRLLNNTENPYIDTSWKKLPPQIVIWLERYHNNEQVELVFAFDLSLS